MTKIDQFESVFRSADKMVFQRQPPAWRKGLLVCDLDEDAAKTYLERVKGFLAVIAADMQWRVVAASGLPTIDGLLDLVAAEEPDLIVSYRNLNSEAWRWPYSLGEHLDLLTQATAVPVLVLPHPAAERAAAHSLENTDAVMAVSGHLTGDDQLVNVAASLTQAGGKLWLTHVEDDAEFRHLLEVIARIPAIDTEVAEEEIAEQLLKEPADYAASCREVLAAAGEAYEVHELITRGHRLRDYLALVEEHEIDLLVLHTKDEDQLAMHGLAYPIAVEFRHVPLLLI